jgi:hypothetical protein
MCKKKLVDGVLESLKSSPVNMKSIQLEHVVETEAEHTLRHSVTDITCARCLFTKRVPAWRKKINLCYRDTASQIWCFAFAAKPDHVGGSFAVGCVVCAKFMTNDCANACT